MAEVTVTQFAEVLKVPVDKLLVQLEEAGIKVARPDAITNEDARLEVDLARSAFAAYEKIFALIERLWEDDAIERLVYSKGK